MDMVKRPRRLRGNQIVRRMMRETRMDKASPVSYPHLLFHEFIVGKPLLAVGVGIQVKLGIVQGKAVLADLVHKLIHDLTAQDVYKRQAYSRTTPSVRWS